MVVAGIISIEKLGMLGVGEKLAYFLLFLAAMAVIFLIVRPLAHWLIAVKATRLLTYLISGCFLLVLLFAGNVLTSKDIYTSNVKHMIQGALEGLAVFGGCLFVVYVLMELFHKWRKRKRKV